MSFPSQSNTQRGALVFPAGEDFTATVTAAYSGSSLNPRLVCIQNNTDSGALKGEIVLPTALTKHTPFLLVDVAAAGRGANVTVIPLDRDQNVRIEAKGTGNAGDLLCMADPTTAADRGKVRTAPGTTGTFLIVGIAEEDFVDGQWVLVRPYQYTLVNP